MSANDPPFRIAVLVKQVPDVNAIRIDTVTRQPEPGAELVMNTYDGYAIGEAINLKESHGAEVTVVCAGPDGARDILMRGLATGADQAVHIVFPQHNEVDTLALANVLSSVLRDRVFDLILTGQTTDDSETGQVPAQLAEMLGLPHVSLVTHIEVESDRLRVHRDAEASKEVVSCSTPAVLMVLSGREGPQHNPSLRGMIAAKRKPFERVDVPIVETARRLSWSDPVAPEKALAGVIVRDESPNVAASKLADWLLERNLIKRQ